jgi:Haem-NO-binding
VLLRLTQANFFVNSGVQEAELWKRLGQEFAILCYQEFPSALRCVGSTVQDFFGSLDCFHGHLNKAEEFQTFRWSPPFVRCLPRADGLDIQYAANDADRPIDLLHFLAGVIDQVAISVFNVHVHVEGLHMEDIKENQKMVSNFIGPRANGTTVQDLLFRVSVREKPAGMGYKSDVAKVLNRHPEKLSEASTFISKLVFV